jgi:hypothetical protein
MLRLVEDDTAALRFLNRFEFLGDLLLFRGNAAAIAHC